MVTEKKKKHNQLYVTIVTVFSSIVHLKFINAHSPTDYQFIQQTISQSTCYHFQINIMKEFFFLRKNERHNKE